MPFQLRQFYLEVHGDGVSSHGPYISDVQLFNYVPSPECCQAIAFHRHDARLRNLGERRRRRLQPGFQWPQPSSVASGELASAVAVGKMVVPGNAAGVGDF